MFKLRVQQQYFDAIASGTKTIEGRLAKKKYTDLKRGDKIQFVNSANTQSVIKKVVATHIYPSFEEAFKKLNYLKAIPHAKNVEEAINVYLQFYSYPTQVHTGVILIELVGSIKGCEIIREI